VSIPASVVMDVYNPRSGSPPNLMAEQACRCRWGRETCSQGVVVDRLYTDRGRGHAPPTHQSRPVQFRRQFRLHPLARNWSWPAGPWMRVLLNRLLHWWPVPGPGCRFNRSDARRIVTDATWRLTAGTRWRDDRLAALRRLVRRYNDIVLYTELAGASNADKTLWTACETVEETVPMRDRRASRRAGLSLRDAPEGLGRLHSPVLVSPAIPGRFRYLEMAGHHSGEVRVRCSALDTPDRLSKRFSSQWVRPRTRRFRGSPLCCLSSP
jgi:hypothetical protein